MSYVKIKESYSQGQPMSNPPAYGVRMKLNYIINTGKILNRFGRARLIKRADGKNVLAGGSDRDYTEAKEWVSLFALTLFSAG
jgi:hypothetical protein